MCSIEEGRGHVAGSHGRAEKRERRDLHFLATWYNHIISSREEKKKNDQLIVQLGLSGEERVYQPLSREEGRVRDGRGRSVYTYEACWIYKLCK